MCKIQNKPVKNLLIFVKSKVKPKALNKKIFIHKLELLGVLIGSRLIKLISAESQKNKILKKRLLENYNL